MMRKQMVHKGLSILIVLVLCAAMVPTAGAVSSVPVTVNGGWTQGTWSNWYAFTLTQPGTVRVATNAPQSCHTLPFDVPVYDGLELDPLLLVPAYDCYQDPPGVSTDPNYYFGNANYFYFTLDLEPGVYDLHWIIASNVLGLTSQANPTKAWVRVDTVTPKDAAIVLTAVNPPDTAWTSVQWLNLAGTQWTDVPGWLGPLDQNEWGFQAHFIDEADLGTGPFRWVVYDKDPRQGGKVWAMTSAFYLPTTGEWLWFKLHQGDKMSAGSAGAAATSAVLFPAP